MVAVTVPETRTPSTTDSSRRSSSTGDPAGTPSTSTPRWAGAGTDRESERIDPGRRPSSRVSSTRGDRGSRRVVALLLSSGMLMRDVVDSAPWSGPSARLPDGPPGAESTQVPPAGQPGSGGGLGVERVRLERAVLGAGQVPARSAPAQLPPAPVHGREGLVEAHLEVGQLGVDVVVHLGPHDARLLLGVLPDPGRLPLRLRDDLRLGGQRQPLLLGPADDPGRLS